MEKKKAYKLVRTFVYNTFDNNLHRKIQRWIASDRDEAEKEEALYAVWNRMDIPVDKNTYQSFEETKRKLNLMPPRRSVRASVGRWLQIAAMLFLPLLTGVATYRYMQSHRQPVEMITCYVPYGEQKQLLLADGTELIANAGSYLIYPERFDGATRTVYLQGEANFAVAKRTNQPFIVETTHLRVEALGTTFTVQAYPEAGKTIATLSSGAIKVGRSEPSLFEYRLQPNQQIEYDHITDQIMRREVAAEDFEAWTRGELSFINQPLTEIFNTVERHFNVQIIPQTALNGKDLYTVAFKNKETVAKVMDVLVQMDGTLSYRIETNTIYMYTNKERRR